MSLNVIDWLWLSNIPKLKFTIIPGWSKYILFLLVPADVFNYSFMLTEYVLRSCLSWSKHCLVFYVPNAYLWIISPWKQKTLILSIPTEAVSLFGMSRQFNLRLDLIVFRSDRVFKVIENMYLSWDGLCSNDISFLWHWSSSIDFSWMVNFDLSFNPLPFSPKPMCIFIMVIILWSFDICIFKRNSCLHNLHIVLLIIWGVCSNQQLLNRRVWIHGSVLDSSYTLLSANHSTVREGHTRQWE